MRDSPGCDCIEGHGGVKSALGFGGSSIGPNRAGLISFAIRPKNLLN
jgi:hypothetical protein